MVTLRFGWRAVRQSFHEMESGALLREVAKLEKFEDNDRNLGEDILGCSTTGCSYGSCSNHVHPRRGGNAGKKNSQCEPWRWTSSLVRSLTLIQTQISGGTSCVDGETHIAKAYQECEWYWEHAIFTSSCPSWQRGFFRRRDTCVFLRHRVLGRPLQFGSVLVLRGVHVRYGFFVC